MEYIQNEQKAPVFEFRCRKCKRSLGNSFNMINKVDEVCAIAFNGTTNTKLSSEIEISRDAFDSGSTFYKVRCACGTDLGRYYMATTRNLSRVCDSYVLFGDKIRGTITGYVDKNIYTKRPSVGNLDSVTKKLDDLVKVVMTMKLDFVKLQSECSSANDSVDVDYAYMT